MVLLVMLRHNCGVAWFSLGKGDVEGEQYSGIEYMEHKNHLLVGGSGGNATYNGGYDDDSQRQGNKPYPQQSYDAQCHNILHFSPVMTVKADTEDNADGYREYQQYLYYMVRILNQLTGHIVGFTIFFCTIDSV